MRWKNQRRDPIYPPVIPTRQVSHRGIGKILVWCVVGDPINSDNRGRSQINLILMAFDNTLRIYPVPGVKTPFTNIRHSGKQIARQVLRRNRKPGAKRATTSISGTNTDSPEFTQCRDARKYDTKPGQPDNPVDSLKVNSQLIWVKNRNEYDANPVPGCNQGNNCLCNCSTRQDCRRATDHQALSLFQNRRQQGQNQR